MNILFLGYWGAKEGLSVATIYPHLRILAEFENIKNIYYFSIEREEKQVCITFDSKKIKHIPLYSGNSLKDKIEDFLTFPQRLVQFSKENKIDKILCRTSPAGTFGYLAWKKNKIPFYVESFEPHADYMLESNVWKKWDIRYVIQKYFENKQKEYASHLMPVSYHHAGQLEKEGVAKNRISVIPCCTDLEKFNFSVNIRDEYRNELNISPNEIVGIYVGKFGDIYYKEEAFDLFAKAFNAIPNFRLIVLTPQEKKLIKEELSDRKIDMEKVFVDRVPHNEVPNYLSASDFAYSLHKSGKSAKSFSPIKTGEYWANGLPILTPDGIGDDSDIIKEEGGGAILDLTNYEASLNKIYQYLTNSNRNKIVKIAIKHRSFNISKNVYRILFS